MLDLKRMKENPQEVIDLLAKKGRDAKDEVARILELDEQRRALVSETDALKAKQNAVSKQIPAMKKAGQDTAPIFAEMNELKETIKGQDAKISAVESELRDLMLALPNLPDPDLLPGGKENNQPLRYFGEPHKFDFEPKNHVELCTALNLIDYERGAKLGGNGFWIYKGMGARLEWALLNYFIDTHIQDGYTFILPLFPGRDAQRERSSPENVCLHPLLPPGSRFLSGRRAGHGPRPPVQQGGNVPVYPAGEVRRGL